MTPDVLQALMRGEVEPPPGARRLVKLDLPPSADLSAAEPWLVGDPGSGRVLAAPIEVVGEGLRLWHDRARQLGLLPGGVVWVMPLHRATGDADMGSTICTRNAQP